MGGLAQIVGEAKARVLRSHCLEKVIYVYVEMIEFSFLRSFLHSNIYVLAAREKGALLKATSKHSSPCLSLDSGLRWTYVEITGAKNGKKNYRS